MNLNSWYGYVFEGQNCSKNIFDDVPALGVNWSLRDTDYIIYKWKLINIELDISEYVINNSDLYSIVIFFLTIYIIYKRKEIKNPNYEIINIKALTPFCVCICVRVCVCACVCLQGWEILESLKWNVFFLLFFFQTKNIWMGFFNLFFVRSWVLGSYFWI